MQDLFNLVNFIQKTKFRSSNLLDVIIEPNTHMGLVYSAIAQQNVQTEEAIVAAYPQFEDESKLAQAKCKLKDRLLDAVFLLDFKESDYTDRQRAFVVCSRKWAAGMILMHKNIRQAGINLLEHLLRHTLHFEFTELSMEILRVLRLHYSTVEGDLKKYHSYESKLQELEETWLAERKAESWYLELIVQYVNAKADKHIAAQKAEEYYEQIVPFLNRFSSFKLHLFGRLIETVIYDSRNDYAGMAAACEQAIVFFNGKEYKSGLFLQLFYYNLITCYLHMRQFEQGRYYVDKLEQLIEEGSFNWFKLQELYFYIAMHTENYREAHQVWLRVQEHPEFSSLPPVSAELWKIFEAYVYFLIQTGVLPLVGEADQLAKFRINRFLNEVQTFSKDKRGMNISVLILQFLFNLSEGKYEQLEERVDAMTKYRTRYLHDKHTLRSNCFIKMLLQIPLSDFNVNEIRRKTQKTAQLLEDTPWETVNQHREIEIIPYERLWAILLDTCLGPKRGNGYSGAKQSHMSR